MLPTLTTNQLCPKKILGGLEYQEFPQSPEHDFKLWQQQFGSKWEPNEDCGVAVPSSGKVSDWKYGTDQTFTLWYVCHNSPKWHAFHKESILRCARDASCALVRQDNIGGPSGVGWDNGGWCKWCLGGFKERLGKRFTSEQLRQLGIPDLPAFDPGAFLRTQLAASKPEALIENPVVREYVRFMLKSNLELWREEVEGAHAIRADIPVCGNQGSGELAAYPTVLLSDVSDLIFLENSRRQYPDNPNTINYALALAGGRHSKPAWIWDFATPEYMEQVDHSLLFIAECYANGATPYYEMNNLAHSPKKGYYPIPLGEKAYDALSGYARFAHQHRELVTRGYAADARVALVYSVSSFAPKVCGALRLNVARQQANHLVGFARFLERGHIPYNVEVLGDDELWPDRDLPRRLSRYSVLVCPNVEAMSDAQADAIRKFVHGGGNLVASGDLGTRDESFAKRTQPALKDLRAKTGNGKGFWLRDEPQAYVKPEAFPGHAGAFQVITLNQTEAKPLVIRGWSKCEQVLGANEGYSLYLDMTYTDGTPVWKTQGGYVASFRGGTHDWQQVELLFHPVKPIGAVAFYALFRHQCGKVWFDDLFFGEEGSDRNLLQSPGFEGDEGHRLPGWKPYLSDSPCGQCGQGNLSGKPDFGYVVDTQAKHSGSASIRCEIPKLAGLGPSEAARTALTRVFQDALQAEGRQVVTDAPSTVLIRPVRLDDQMVVHLLNYDYDSSQDKVKSIGPFRLALRLPSDWQAISGDVMLASPDGPAKDTVLPHRLRKGRLEVMVPQLRIWALLHFGVRQR